MILAGEVLGLLLLFVSEPMNEPSRTVETIVRIFLEEFLSLLVIVQVVCTADSEFKSIVLF